MSSAAALRCLDPSTVAPSRRPGVTALGSAGLPVRAVGEQNTGAEPVSKLETQAGGDIRHTHLLGVWKWWTDRSQHQRQAAAGK